MNLIGSVGGKYGASTHFSAHLRLRILQAAQGLRTSGGEGCSRGRGEEDEGEEERDWVGDVVVGVEGVSLYSIVARESESARERERERGR